jgi:hypothetical protein
MVTVIVLIVELSEAVRAGGDIGRDEDVLVVSCLAGLNREGGVLTAGLGLSVNPFDTGERRGFVH